MKEPTAEECSNQVPILVEGRVGPAFACWYPQMGGYVGKAVVVLSGGGCFDVYVWHDGEFGFGGDSPVKLHHCDPEQFIQFGEMVLAAQNKKEG